MQPTITVVTWRDPQAGGARVVTAGFVSRDEPFSALRIRSTVVADDPRWRASELVGAAFHSEVDIPRASIESRHDLGGQS